MSNARQALVKWIMELWLVYVAGGADTSKLGELGRHWRRFRRECTLQLCHLTPQCLILLGERIFIE